MFLALPYYSHSIAKTVHSCFLYTTLGNAEDAEFQGSVYTNDTQGYYIHVAGMRLHRRNSSHLHTLTGTVPSSANLNSNNETELTDLVQGTLLSLFV